MRKACIGIGLWCLVLSSLYADIDPTLARIKLHTVEVITQKQFKSQIENLEKQLNQPVTLDQKRQLLDAMIDQKILLQEANISLIRVNDSDIEQLVNVYKRNLALQSGINRDLTDAELERFLKQQDYTMEKFRDQLKDQILLEKFVVETQKAMFGAEEEPKQDEIYEYYEENRTKYPIVSPEMMSFKQIVLMTGGLSDQDKQIAKDRGVEIQRELQSGSSFDKYLEVYMRDNAAKKLGGITFETWRRDDEATKVTYGKTFFDRVFKMDTGERSGVLTSNIGYHIVEIIDKIPFRVLNLGDKIPPQNNVTVSECIRQLLKQSKHNQIMVTATKDLVNELKKKADVQIMEKNLVW